jgi:hypothetical protein
MLQLQCDMTADVESRGGECVTVYLKEPQWQDAVYVALGAVEDGDVGRERLEGSGGGIVDKVPKSMRDDEDRVHR